MFILKSVVKSPVPGTEDEDEDDDDSDYPRSVKSSPFFPLPFGRGEGDDFIR